MPADQRDRRAHPDAHAPRSGAAQLTALRKGLGLAGLLVCGAISAAGVRGSLAAGAPRGAPAAATSFPLPDLAQGAASDLLLLDAIATARGSTANPDTTGVAARLATGSEAIRRARESNSREGDLLLTTPIAVNEALLLRLRTQEGLEEVAGRALAGVRHAAYADSFEAALRQRQDELPSSLGALLPLAAGLRPSRAEAARIVPILLSHLRTRRLVSGPAALLGLHALAPYDSAALAAACGGGANDAWEEAARATARAALTNRRVQLFAADDPARRLRLAVRTLAASGAVPLGLVDRAVRLPRFDPGATSVDTADVRAELDAIAAQLGDNSRTTPILGSRRDYYRKPGTTAPDLDPNTERLARSVGLDAIDALRARLDSNVLSKAGITATCGLEPDEIVPGQQVAATWTLTTQHPVHIAVQQSRIDHTSVAFSPKSWDLTADASATGRTLFVSLPTLTVGATQVPDLELAIQLDNGTVIRLHDRVPVRVVAPVQAALVPVGDALLDSTRKGVDVVVTSRAPRPLSGTLRVLATTDWTVEPSHSYAFTLRRPGQTARAHIDLALPHPGSPGPYELAVRLDVDGETVGTLRTRLVKPMEWVVAGPFGPGPKDGTLPPERGASLSARYTGQGGRQIAWRIAPRDAFDPDGALDLEALFPAPAPGARACALTVFEAPEAAPILVQVEGIEHALWNGAPLPATGPVPMLRGRNTLLVRSRVGEEGWRLPAELHDLDGAPLRVLANDLARLLDGYADLERAPVTPVTGQPADRVIVLHYPAGRASQEVAVLGTFNAWVPLGLQRQPDGTWLREMRLRPGRYAYKLLVDGRLRADPTAPDTEPDGFGGRNSLLLVP